MKGFFRASFERVQQQFFSVVERVQQKASPPLLSQKGV